MRIGVIVHDPLGEVLATLHSPRENITNLAIAETVAAREIMFAKEMGWRRVMFEGDSLQVVLALQQNGKIWRSYG
jgi:hypothetical protein